MLLNFNFKLNVNIVSVKDDLKFVEIHMWKSDVNFAW